MRLVLAPNPQFNYTSHMDKDRLTLLLLRQDPRNLTLAMAAAKAEAILAKRKEDEAKAFTTRFFAKGDHAPNPIKQLNDL